MKKLLLIPIGFCLLLTGCFYEPYGGDYRGHDRDREHDHYNRYDR